MNIGKVKICTGCLNFPAPAGASNGGYPCDTCNDDYSNHTSNKSSVKTTIDVQRLEVGDVVKFNDAIAEIDEINEMTARIVGLDDSFGRKVSIAELTIVCKNKDRQDKKSIAVGSGGGRKPIFKKDGMIIVEY